MPELPEVETCRSGIEPHILNQIIKDIVIRQHKLRWPIPKKLPEYATKQRIKAVTRRGKYLLINLETGTIIIHLGMSGSIRICNPSTPAGKHDHIDIICDNNKAIRLTDPRKFGCVLWTKNDPLTHKLLNKLGPEPLDSEFNDDMLYNASRKRTCSIKSYIMNSHIVVGVGNIYACEALFLAGINPKRKSGSLTKTRYQKLTTQIKKTLRAAIKQGGTTLKDFTRENGQPGYFAQELNVYGRAGLPCVVCHKPLTQITQQQRSTFYCTKCQK